ncbi:hypothetical protein [Paenibacillus thiaminolyticus]|uniref:hypothetical protein n=1 Tax=Paenibacillus thiaminolyticus TaxID=49283 RepID=UPI0011652ADB|nr:hypothetical protein [Paenibacillus thiaminolyticus]
MISSLEILIDPLIRNRIESMYSNLKNANSEFMQISKESAQYFKTIRESLPDNLQHTLFLYEDAQFSLQAILESNIYLQGFKDALHLYNELHISRN